LPLNLARRNGAESYLFTRARREDRDLWMALQSGLYRSIWLARPTATAER